MAERISFQINYFEKSKRSEFKKWASKNETSIRLLLYALLNNREDIQKLIAPELKVAAKE